MSKLYRANYNPAAVSRLMAAFRTVGPKALEAFSKARPLPNTVEVPLTLWERFKTFLPRSWSRNHRTKWVYDGPATIKFNRRSPF